VSIQVHFVNVAEPPTEDNLFPFLAICNPFDFDIVNYATGEHD